MKRLLLLLLLSHADICSAQCIVMTMNLDECVTCRMNSLLFNPQSTGLPTFIVFPLQHIADSTDIEYAGRFRKNGIKLVFSDSWYKRLYGTQHASCVYGLDTKGNIVFHQLLKDVSAQSLEQYINENQPQQLESETTFEYYTDSLYYCLKLGTGVLKVNDLKNNKPVSTIRSSEVDLKWISDQLHGKQKEKFDTYGVRLNRQLDNFEPKFRAFGLGKEGDVLMLYQYYNTTDSISKNIKDDFCLIRYDASGKFKELYPLDYDYKYTPYDFSFVMENDTSIYMNLCPYEGFEETLKKRTEPLYYIAHFKRRNGRFTFDKFVPYEIPEPYRSRFFENFLSSNFSTFPYVANYFSNELYDIKTGVSTSIIPLSQFSAAVKDTSGLSNDMHFRAYGISLDNKANRLIVPYQLYDKAFVNSYTPDLKLRSCESLSDAYIRTGKITYLNAYPENNLLQVAYVDKGQSLSLNVPLDLVQPQ